MAKYKKLSAELLLRLNKIAPSIEWSSELMEVNGKQKLVIEAYSPLRNRGVGISIGDKPTTKDIDITVNTIIAQANILNEETLIDQIEKVEIERGS